MSVYVFECRVRLAVSDAPDTQLAEMIHDALNDLGKIEPENPEQHLAVLERPDGLPVYPRGEAWITACVIAPVEVEVIGPLKFSSHRLFDAPLWISATALTEDDAIGVALSLVPVIKAVDHGGDILLTSSPA